MELLNKEITSVILKVYYDVYNELGYGFLEKYITMLMLYELQ